MLKHVNKELTKDKPRIKITKHCTKATNQNKDKINEGSFVGERRRGFYGPRAGAIPPDEAFDDLQARLRRQTARLQGRFPLALQKIHHRPMDPVAGDYKHDKESPS